MNHNFTRRAKPAILMVGTAIALLAAAATAHTTSQPFGGANDLLHTELGKNNHPLVNSKSQLLHMLSKNMESHDGSTLAAGRQSSIQTQIRPEVWAGPVTVMEETIF